MSKSRVGFISTKALEGYLQGLEVEGCTVKYDKQVGVAEGFDDGFCVFRAIQKGRGGHWITRFIDGERISWTDPEGQP